MQRAVVAYQSPDRPSRLPSLAEVVRHHAGEDRREDAGHQRASPVSVEPLGERPLELTYGDHLSTRYCRDGFSDEERRRKKQASSVTAVLDDSGSEFRP